MAFSGEGAFRYGGRWNSRGVPVVYLGGNPSISALEIVVNTDDSEDLYRIPYVLIPVDFDEALVTRPQSLPDDWKQDPPPPSCAAVGDEWLRSDRSAVLEVPSAVIPLVCCLLNNSDIFVFSKGHFPGSFDLRQNLLSLAFQT